MAQKVVTAIRMLAPRPVVEWFRRRGFGGMDGDNG
jgi:hypothetical protein